MFNRIQKIRWKPSPGHELLLQASLFHGKEAAEAWEKWKTTHDPEHLDYASYRMLPLVYRNLLKQNVEDSLMGKLKGIYRLHWAKNQILFRQLPTVLSAFHESGIDVMILKGTALLLEYYEDYGIRPMFDLDILVKEGQLTESVELLKQLGWKTKQHSMERYIPIFHAMPFEDREKREIDLHWHLLYEDCKKHSDDDFWENAVLTEVNNIPVYILDPTDQLFHICIHGLRRDRVPTFRWVADAKKVLEKKTINWQRLVGHAKKHDLILTLQSALAYLQDFKGIAIPDGVLRQMQDLPFSKIEYAEYRFKLKQKPGRILGDLPVHWFWYIRRAGHHSLPKKIIGFSRHLQYLWGVKYFWLVPLLFIYKGLHRTWRFLKSLLHANHVNVSSQ